MQIVVDDLLVQYELAGKGKLVLLLHGWGDSSKGLSGLQASLSKKHRVLSLDLPGFGASEAPKAVWDLDNYAAFVQATLQKLSLEQPYAVIGHSNGGALAVRATSLGSISPQKLVLIAASGVRSGQKAKRTVLKIVAKTGNVATMWLPRKQRNALRKRLYKTVGSDMLVVPQLEETFKKTVRQDVQRDATKLALPTLLIYARDDQAVPLADGQTYHRLIENSQLEVLPDAGHFVHVDQPEKVTKLIMEFLK